MDGSSNRENINEDINNMESTDSINSEGYGNRRANSGGHMSGSVSAKYVMLFSALLLLTNIVLGVVMFNQSRVTVRELVQKNMLSISNTAADLIDGDIMGSFTDKDVGSAAWRDVIRDLSAFQNNNDIEFIYTVRKISSDKFVFLVDPDPVDPGELGEEVVITEALIKAGMGIASVDSEPAQDDWGNFYSSYSPVYDSNGRITAIVGVDFDANWYEAEVGRHMKPAIFIIVIFMIIGGLIVFLFSRKMLQRLRALSTQLSELTVNVDELITELSEEAHVYIDKDTAGARRSERSDSVQGDEIAILSSRLQEMQEEVKLYQSFTRARAFTDVLTGVRNTTAYAAMQEELEQDIRAGEAEFCLILFDINYLKNANDRYGHTAGDELIRSSGHLIADAFGVTSTYRIGGDEFLVIQRNADEKMVRDLLNSLDHSISEYNAGRDGGAPLSISRGYAFFTPGQSSTFKEVFVRADEAMYRNKEAMHRHL